MKKKWICTVCGYVHEGDEAPEFCPQCKQPKSKFKELVETEGALQFVDEHVLGVAKGVDPVILEGLNAHFMGECRSEERRVGKECRSRWSPYH